MELDFYEFLALISIHAPREGCDIWSLIFMSSWP